MCGDLCALSSVEEQIVCAMVEAENEAAVLRAVLRAHLAQAQGLPPMTRLILREREGDDVPTGQPLILPDLVAAARLAISTWGEVARVNPAGQVSTDAGATWKELEL